MQPKQPGPSLSWQPDRRQLKSPYYKSLADLLEAQIRSGALTSGAKLPPQRELADYLGLHFTTVTRAYDECKRRNLIYGVTGSGTFVSPQAVKPISNSMDTMLRHSTALGFGSAIEMGFVSSFEETNQLVAQALPRLIQGLDLTDSLNYSNPTGTERHREIGLRWMAQLGIQAPVSQTAIVSGSMNGLALCCLSLFKSGDRIAVDYYINNNVIELAKLLQLQLVPVAMDREGMIPEALDAACQQVPIKGLYLMPSCNNPTTIHCPIARKAALAEVIRQRGLTVLEDDHYGFASAGYLSDYVAPLRELVPDQCVYICNTTTSICSGLRIAFLVFPYRYLDAIHHGICNVNVKTSVLDAEVLCQLIESGTAWEIARKKVELSRQANGIFNDIFPENFQGHPYSFFRWLEIPQELRGAPIGWELLAQGVHVYHSRRFTCCKEDQSSYLRIALSSANSLEELQQGLLKIKDYLASGRS